LVDHNPGLGRAEDVFWWLQRPCSGLSHGCSEVASLINVAEIGLSSESARLWLSLPQFGIGRDIDTSALALTQGKDVCRWLHAHVHGITELYLRTVCLPPIDNNSTASRAYGNDRTRVQNFTRDTTYGFGTSIRRGEQILATAGAFYSMQPSSLRPSKLCLSTSSP
jgi:hypothetical protein